MYISRSVGWVNRTGEIASGYGIGMVFFVFFFENKKKVFVIFFCVVAVICDAGRIIYI